LQEQPLLLEELLEQEKREQERQQQAQAMQDPSAQLPPAGTEAGPGLLSDMDFERLRADVLRTPTPGGSPSGLSPPAMPGMYIQLKVVLNHSFSFNGKPAR
jgi:histone-lysine N-methyltransferase MLL3